MNVCFPKESVTAAKLFESHSKTVTVINYSTAFMKLSDASSVDSSSQSERDRLFLDIMNLNCFLDSYLLKSHHASTDVTSPAISSCFLPIYKASNQRFSNVSTHLMIVIQQYTTVQWMDVLNSHRQPKNTKYCRNGKTAISYWSALDESRSA